MTAAELGTGATAAARSGPSWRGALLGSLLATLEHPRWWAIALAGFLVRGGALVVLLPIVALPSVATITGLVAPIVTPILLGGNVGPALPVALVGLAVLVPWLLVGGWVGAWFDLVLAAEAGADEDLDLGVTIARRPTVAAVAARLLPHLATAIAAAIGAVRLVSAIYNQMVSPTEPATPLVVRVVRDAPEAVALLVGAWLLAEAVGGLALRRVAMRRPGHADAPFGAWRAIGRAADGVTRLRGFATLVVVDLVVLVAIVPGWVAAARSWGAVRILLGDGGSFEELAAGLALLVGSWLGGLCLLGVTLAWRATVWSVEAARATTAAD